MGLEVVAAGMDTKHTGGEQCYTTVSTCSGWAKHRAAQRFEVRCLASVGSGRILLALLSSSYSSLLPAAAAQLVWLKIRDGAPIRISQRSRKVIPYTDSRCKGSTLLRLRQCTHPQH